MHSCLTLLLSFLSLLGGSQKATLVFAGDAMQHQAQLEASARQHGAYDYAGCFDDIAPWVSNADYAVVNLETTLNTSDFTGYPCFSSPVSYARALRDAGFDLMLNANNHTLDRGSNGLKRTIATLDSLHVDHIGTYLDAASRAQQVPLIRNVNGFKIAFLNYTYGTNGIKARQPVVVDYIDRQRIADDIALARRRGAELVVVMPHWGVEYVTTENAQQRSLAQFMIDHGADMVIGGHPHVIQPVHLKTDTVTGRQQLVAYSLGNFISGMRTLDTRGGIALQVNLSRDDQGRPRIDDAQWRPVFSVPGTRGKRSYRLVCLDPDRDIAAAVGTAYASHARAYQTAANRVMARNTGAVSRYQPSK